MTEIEEAELDVYINESFVHILEKRDNGLDPFEALACLVPEESRAFNREKINELLTKLETDDSSAEVIGWNEFPYKGRGWKEGEDRTVEREYWVKLGKDVFGDLGGEDGLAILHVHYAGKWIGGEGGREKHDRDTILQLNLRHTSKVASGDPRLKCQKLEKWRERHGTSALDVPSEGWKWQEQADQHPVMFKLLRKAEACACRVRGRVGVELKSQTDHSRKALVIYAEEYRSKDFSDLKNASTDANSLKSCLQLDNWGWDVNLLPADMKQIRTWLKKAGNTGPCLFAFVGHGVAVKNRHFLVPEGTTFDTENWEAEVVSQCISLSEVFRLFKEMRNDAHPTIFVLDCCREEIQQGNVSDSVLPFHQETCVPNSAILFSTTAGKLASDGRPGQGGPFMTAFVQAIKEGPGKDLDEIVRDTKSKLPKDAQAPNWNTNIKERFFLCQNPPRAANNGAAVNHSGRTSVPEAPLQDPFRDAALKAGFESRQLQMEPQLLELLESENLVRAKGPLLGIGVRSEEFFWKLEEGDVDEMIRDYKLPSIVGRELKRLIMKIGASPISSRQPSFEHPSETVAHPEPHPEPNLHVENVPPRRPLPPGPRPNTGNQKIEVKNTTAASPTSEPARRSSVPPNPTVPSQIGQPALRLSTSGTSANPSAFEVRTPQPTVTAPTVGVVIAQAVDQLQQETARHDAQAQLKHQQHHQQQQQQLAQAQRGKRPPEGAATQRLVAGAGGRAQVQQRQGEVQGGPAAAAGGGGEQGIERGAGRQRPLKQRVGIFNTWKDRQVMVIGTVMTINRTGSKAPPGEGGGEMVAKVELKGCRVTAKKISRQPFAFELRLAASSRLHFAAASLPECESWLAVVMAASAGHEPPPAATAKQPAPQQGVLEAAQLRKGGLGLQISTVRDGRLCVISVIPGSPADRAHVTPGHEIIKVGGVAVSEFGQFKAMVSRTVGPNVQITLRAARNTPPYTRMLTRQET